MQNNIYSSLLNNYISAHAGYYNTAPAPAYNNFALQNTNQIQKDEYQNTKKAKIAKAALASAVVLTAATTIFAAFRHKGGLTKTIGGGIEKIKTFFSSNTKKTQDASKELAKKAGNLAEYQNGANNVTNAKDSILKHYLSKIPGYKKFDEWSANIYKKACEKSVAKGYKRALSSVENAKAGIDEAVKNNSLNEKNASRIKELISKNANAATANSGVSKRFNTVDKSMLDLQESAIDSIKSIKSTPTGVVDGIKKYSRESLIKQRLNQSKSLQNNLLAQVKNEGLTAKEAKELNELLGGIKDKNLLRKINKANTTFQKAFAKENSAMFDKLRDINCGSAASDILSAAGTAGLLGIYTAQANSKEEKIGVTLTTGIPLGVTVATTLGATIKMISGAKAMMLGLGTGFLANQLGKIANKKYHRKHNIQKPEKTIATLEDYSKTIRSKFDI